MTHSGHQVATRLLYAVVRVEEVFWMTKFVISIESGEITIITDNNVNDSSPSWSGQ